LTRQITGIARHDVACQRLIEIPGFGALSATALASVDTQKRQLIDT